MSFEILRLQSGSRASMMQVATPSNQRAPLKTTLTTTVLSRRVVPLSPRMRDSFFSDLDPLTCVADALRRQFEKVR